MSWLVWRQYRAQGAIAVALLAAAAAVILADGFQIASHWHSILATCSGNTACLQQASLVNGTLGDLPYISLVVPAVLGILWGAPLVAHELETRTSDFAWTQSVTRTRWLTVKAGWLLLAAAACGGTIAALTTWWSGPGNAQHASAFEPGHFDTQGIVPIGYAVRHLSALQPLLAIPGHRDRDLRPAGRGPDRGHIRHRPQEGRTARIAPGDGEGSTAAARRLRRPAHDPAALAARHRPARQPRRRPDPGRHGPDAHQGTTQAQRHRAPRPSPSAA
jgi:hypothetical protein